MRLNRGEGGRRPGEGESQSRRLCRDARRHVGTKCKHIAPDRRLRAPLTLPFCFRQSNASGVGIARVPQESAMPRVVLLCFFAVACLGSFAAAAEPSAHSHAAERITSLTNFDVKYQVVPDGIA